MTQVATAINPKPRASLRRAQTHSPAQSTPMVSLRRAQKHSAPQSTPMVSLRRAQKHSALVSLRRKPQSIFTHIRFLPLFAVCHHFLI
jgi:hypothetical protein